MCLNKMKVQSMYSYRLVKVILSKELLNLFFKIIFSFYSFCSDFGLYTYLFVEYMSNGVFGMHFVDIDAKYHFQRYATIIWHYVKQRKMNMRYVVSESEVTKSVANNFDGPLIVKRHALNTTNYPTLRSRRSKLTYLIFWLHLRLFKIASFSLNFERYFCVRYNFKYSVIYNIHYFLRI